MAGLDLTKLPPFRSAEEILSHPRFPYARDEFIKAILALYEHRPSLNRLLLEASRTVLFGMVMCLQARYDESDRASWLTTRLIADSMVEHGFASARRVHDLIARLIKAGYLNRRKARRDRRTSILRPTEKMIVEDQNFLAAHYLPLHILFPEPGYGPIMTRDRAFQLKQRLVSAALFAQAARILASNPIVTLFLSRDGGTMILIKMIQMARTAGNGGRPGMSYADLGGRFGVSRTQVRKLLIGAEEAGLVRLTQAGGRLAEITPELLQAYDRFLAEAISGYDLCYQLAR